MMPMGKYDELCCKINYKFRSYFNLLTKWSKSKIHCKIASHHNISIKFNDFALANE